MRPITSILIAISLVAAGGITYAGKKVLENSAREAARKQDELKRDIEVLVAARDLPQGHLLKGDDLRWDRWPLATANMVQVITRQDGKDVLDHLPGRTLRRTVMMGEPMPATAVFNPGKAGPMPAMIAAGKKAVGITVNAASTASGFVLPGDFVDVILTVDLSKAGGGLPGGGRYVAETILSGVRVLAVDQEYSPESKSSAKSTTKKAKAKKKPEKDPSDETPEDAAMVGKTVAIEVTADEAERVLAAQAAGKLSLALRSMAEGTEDEGRGIPYATDVSTSQALRRAQSGGVKIIKGGEGAR
ncbi:MAG: Flp pilus assembly protein CpaB [Solirubrobacterales bacterium]